MKKTLIKLLPILLILIVVGVSFVPNVASAENLLTGATVSFVNNMLAGIANILLGLTSTLVIVSGIFLSISINITTHIGDFFNSIPALKDVWVVVRNISSMFIIFMLLYTSITTILGGGTSNLKKLVGNIIMVGLLINFSLFFTKVLIDTSNLVSLQFYRAIAPNTSENFSTGKVFTDGGLSNVFMSSLKIPQIYQNKGVLTAVDVSASIFFATVGGMIMMITASISFFAAAIMFTVRTGILLFIMALSPLFFAAMIFPQAKEKADGLKKLFFNQLIFMPAYLFLMYISLRLISSPEFSAIFNQNATGIAQAGEAAFGPTFVGIIIQYIIALFFINAPLVFALKAGGMGASWAPNMHAVAGFVGQHSFGRFAKNRAEALAKSDWAVRNPNMAILANKGLGVAAGATYGGTKGYEKRFKSYKEDREKFGKGLKLDDSVKAAYVSSGLKTWDSKSQSLERKLEAAKRRAEDPSLTDEERNKAQSEVAKIAVEIKDRNDAMEKGTRDKHLENEALKARKEAYAANVEGGFDPTTSAARKAAAKAIRDEINKSDEKKFMEQMQKLAKDAEAGGGEKPPEGDKK